MLYLAEITLLLSTFSSILQMRKALLSEGLTFISSGDWMWWSTINSLEPLNWTACTRARISTNAAPVCDKPH